MSSEKEKVTEFQAPEGLWKLSLDASTNSVVNQISPKIDVGVPFEAATKASTILVNGDSNSGLGYGINGAGTKASAKNAKTLFAGGMLVYDTHIQSNSSNYKDNVTNIAEYGKMVNNPTHFSVISAPYRTINAKKSENDERKIFGLLNKSKKDKQTPDLVDLKDSSSKTLKPNGSSDSQVKTFATTNQNTNEPSPKGSNSLVNQAQNGTNQTSESDISLNSFSNQDIPIKGIISRATSSFVVKLVQAYNLAKWLSSADAHTSFMFFNATRSFVWAGRQCNEKDQILARIEFSENTPTCHDVNLMTRSESRIDIIFGFESGDLMCYDPLQGKYDRLNKTRENIGSITKVKWVPGSETQFMASTSTGLIMLIDRHKDYTWAHPQKTSPNPPVQTDFSSINNIAFSPDCQHLAAVGKDGYLRIIDYINEELKDVYPSYFGSFACVTWSYDGKYILTGGNDDTVTIWSFYERRIVARCMGHDSWVTGVAFDTFLSDNPNDYRFASIGEDTKLLFWDFSIAALSRPKVFQS
ncbi:hypothetical protein BB558_005534 [Smittium angustum]|uniref:Uncharacterized protein n=1 Tax=Smittium angustum TaxID=133377 RepID=A0A2U1J062_SMIAN|nr:hypothetical protein BB558_005534 [Smittium angustum]